MKTEISFLEGTVMPVKPSRRTGKSKAVDSISPSDDLQGNFCLIQEPDNSDKHAMILLASKLGAVTTTS